MFRPLWHINSGGFNLLDLRPPKSDHCDARDSLHKIYKGSILNICQKLEKKYIFFFERSL